MDLKEEVEKKALAIVEQKQEVEKKSLGDVAINDVEFVLDKTKKYEDQAEDVVGAIAIANAVNDEKTVKDLSEKKAEELKAKASKKLKDAQAKDIFAEADRQEAERKKYEAVLSTFGITKHLPNWLLKTMVILLSPVFILLTTLIGLPCGVVKILIDNIDNILVRYESAETQSKGKIKVTVWIIFVLAIVLSVGVFVLKMFNKI